MKFPWSKPKVTQLQDMIDRAMWIAEIENTRGFQLIERVVKNELEAARQMYQRVTPDELRDLQAWERALHFLSDVIVRWRVDGEYAADTLYGKRMKELTDKPFPISTPNSNEVKVNG